MTYELWKRVAQAAIAAIVVVVATVLSEELARIMSTLDPGDGPGSGSLHPSIPITMAVTVVSSRACSMRLVRAGVMFSTPPLGGGLPAGSAPI